MSQRETQIGLSDSNIKETPPLPCLGMRLRSVSFEMSHQGKQKSDDDPEETEQKSDSEPLSPSPQTSTSHFSLKSIVGIVATAVLLLGVSRTTMLVVLTYELPRSCEMNSTQMNSSDCAEIAAESDHKSRYYQVTDLLYAFYSSLNWVEYAILAHGLYNLLTKTSNTMVKPGEAALPNPDPRADAVKSSLNQRPSLYPRADLKKLFIKVRENKGKHYKVWLGAPLVAVFVTIYILASLATPVVGIIHAYTANECYRDCKEQHIILTSHLTYQSLTIVAHIVNVTIRAAMIIAVLEVRAIWFNEHRIDNIADIYRLPNNTDTRHYQCIISYEKRVTKIKRLLRVFQTWFVFQWFHYFFQSVTNLTRVLLPVTTGINHSELIIAYRGVYAVYDTLAFAIPHVCGLKMNTYHAKYLKDERKKLLEAAPPEEYVKVYSMKIEKNKYGDFVPGIRMTGIKIPLDSAGYTLGILFTIISLTTTFISFRVE